MQLATLLIRGVGKWESHLVTGAVAGSCIMNFDCLKNRAIRTGLEFRNLFLRLIYRELTDRFYCPKIDYVCGTGLGPPSINGEGDEGLIIGCRGGEEGN